ncbi:hypothetical protein FH972_010434 [Carpinus fangiana]|uniref:SKP1 component POZ domain-containing protein n=1 Tax=Carpinus fangiana TaxID=176857 RepID=A0A660KQ74_9ROSI|nr:hypothetical protein FH972_010434 [Carpinus fangiana]
MSTMSSSKKITLKSSDGEVDEAMALELLTIKHMIEEDCADNVIHLPNVRSKILAKVIEYCNQGHRVLQEACRGSVDKP